MYSLLKQTGLFFMVIFIHSILPTAFAQTNSRTEIHWDPVKHVVLPGDSTTSATLHFSGAASDFSKNFLPFYEEKIPLPSNDFIMEVEVKDQAYIQLPIDSLANVADIDKIDNELHVTTSTRIIRKQAYGFFKLHPYKKTESGDILLLQSFTLDVSFRLKQQKENKERHQYAANSVLSTGDWHKIKISRSGIFKLSYTDLAGYGIPVSSIDPAKIQVFGNGGKQLPYNNSNPNPDDLIENAIYVSDGNDGSFDPGDYILFYGQGPHSWKYNYRLKRFTYEQHEYDESAYYFITYGQATGKRIQQLTGPTQPANIFTSTYNSYRVHENDSLNLIKSGRRWFGEKYDIITDYNYNFNFPDLDQSQPVLFRISVAARHTSPTQFRFNINGNIRNMLIDAISGSYQSYYANSSTDTFSLSITSNTINIDATYQKPASTASGWMDYIEVNAREHLHFKAPQLEFRDINVTDSGNIAEYSISNASAGVMVWDINDVNNPVVVNTQLNGNTLSFKATADSIRNFIAHKNTYYKPVYAGTVANQNLHALAQPDMVIVTHPKLAEQAEEIAELHRNLDKMIVHVIEPGLIYNEFSSGQQDITAIRNFMRMFYDRATSTAEMPRYLLLMGDGNYDPKNRNNYDRATILTFQSYNSLNPGRSFVSDDYYGLLDPGEGVNASGALDIGIGRIPVGSTAEADNAVAKIKRYLRLDTAEINNELTANPALVPPLGDWKNEICLVADDEDGGSHVINADKLAKKINNMYPSYVVDKIYFDAYKQVTTPGGQRYPEANKAINETMR
ncbi:MAG: type IX secretion system sortase PorU, partial [Bacteroidota bacterium]